MKTSIELEMIQPTSFSNTCRDCFTSSMPSRTCLMSDAVRTLMALTLTSEIFKTRNLVASSKMVCEARNVMMKFLSEIMYVISDKTFKKAKSTLLSIQTQ